MVLIKVGLFITTDKNLHTCTRIYRRYIFLSIGFDPKAFYLILNLISFEFVYKISLYSKVCFSLLSTRHSRRIDIYLDRNITFSSITTQSHRITT